MLVWPDERTTWTGSSIQFDVGSHPQTLTNGEHVALGGGFGASAADLPFDAWIASVHWTSKPSRSCDTGTRWFVAGIAD